MQLGFYAIYAAVSHFSIYYDNYRHSSFPILLPVDFKLRTFGCLPPDLYYMLAMGSENTFSRAVKTHLVLFVQWFCKILHSLYNPGSVSFLTFRISLQSSQEFCQLVPVLHHLIWIDPPLHESSHLLLSTLHQLQHCQLSAFYWFLIPIF